MMEITECLRSNKNIRTCFGNKSQCSDGAPDDIGNRLSAGAEKVDVARLLEHDPHQTFVGPNNIEHHNNYPSSRCHGRDMVGNKGARPSVLKNKWYSNIPYNINRNLESYGVRDSTPEHFWRSGVSLVGGRFLSRLPNRMSFSEWLMAKNKLAAQRAHKESIELARRAEEDKIRKQLSEKCYAEWLACKEQRKNPASSVFAKTQRILTTSCDCEYRPAPSRGSFVKNGEVKGHVKEWERVKAEEEDSQKEKLHIVAVTEAQTEEGGQLLRPFANQLKTPSIPKSELVLTTRGVNIQNNTILRNLINPRRYDVGDKTRDIMHSLKCAYQKAVQPRQIFQQSADPLVSLPLSVAQRSLQSRFIGIHK
ncbi:uncharacterized protein LOC115624573 isoform X2 [Scaptodrosophila lebanonensis]|uniref:Uncharacterized protein LOC115624573 isoform X2 n=1 Tax=Drosophila lebanonensis TaxID=7225 RepID=A0A6J2TGN6_DROLE|nr:uncharacterized protein LOC115624573 isoform X2 [Scaptodrosophila lebanonensis]